jgi:hypothetical protein
MAENAHRRATDPAAAASALGQEIVVRDSATTGATQAITLPTLADARARLLDLIRRRPAPKPQPDYVTRRDVTRWARETRLREAQQTLHLIPDNSLVATALRVAPSTVRRWRAGTHSPTVRHWRQLRALRALLHGRWP